MLASLWRRQWAMFSLCPARVTDHAHLSSERQYGCELNPLSPQDVSRGFPRDPAPWWLPTYFTGSLFYAKQSVHYLACFSITMTAQWLEDSKLKPSSTGRKTKFEKICLVSILCSTVNQNPAWKSPDGPSAPRLRHSGDDASFSASFQPDGRQSLFCWCFKPLGLLGLFCSVLFCFCILSA